MEMILVISSVCNHHIPLHNIEYNLNLTWSFHFFFLQFNILLNCLPFVRTFIFIEICAETRVKKLGKRKERILWAFSSPSLRDVYFLICEHSKVKQREWECLQNIYYFYIYTSTSAAVAVVHWYFEKPSGIIT